jgi:hypothetical protein
MKSVFSQSLILIGGISTFLGKQKYKDSHTCTLFSKFINSKKTLPKQ